MTAIGAAMDALAADLRVELPGVHVTRDAGAIAAPCVYIGPPRIDGRTLSGWLVEVPVYAVGRHPFDTPEQDALLALQEQLARAMDYAQADFRNLQTGENVTHPVYGSTVRRLIGETT